MNSVQKQKEFWLFGGVLSALTLLFNHSASSHKQQRCTRGGGGAGGGCNMRNMKMGVGS